ncbi:M10 family metallopeptidase C-terminal domain-containing protein [Xanthobacter sediminis]
MTITITVGTTAGLNYDEFLGATSSSFLYGHTADPAYGEFYGTGHTIFGGPQHLVAASPVDGTATSTEKGVLATGDFDYTFATHTLDGTLNRVEFGYGPRLNTAGAGGADSYVTLDSGTALTIDGLNLTTSGAGTDTVHSILYGFISDTAEPLTSYLAAIADGVEFYGNSGNDTFTGYGHDDIINGAGGADVLNGAGGNDTIIGGAGNDTLTGGAGQDTLNGGLGADTFVFATGGESAAGAADTITAFTSGTDKIDLGWAATWDSTPNSAGEVYFDATNKLLYGRDASNVAFEIFVTTGSVVSTDLI